jgi:hypothetical protein
MRSVLMLLAIAGLAFSQAMTEAAGVIAGGSVGGVAGKKVGQGITNVFQKVDGTTAKAAKADKTEKPTGVEKPKQNAGTVLQVGPGGVVKDHSLVPPPPPPTRKTAGVPPPPPLPVQPVVTALQPIPPPPPPPRKATPDDLSALAGGTSRADVLKLGAPSSRITMFDNGHLVEIFRYQTRDATFGVVRLSDGSVSSVEVR